MAPCGVKAQGHQSAGADSEQLIIRLASRRPPITTSHGGPTGYSSLADIATSRRSALEEVDRMMSCLGNAWSVPTTQARPSEDKHARGTDGATSHLDRGGN